MPTFRDHLSVPSSRVKNLKGRPVGCTKMSVRNTTICCLIAQKSAILSTSRPQPEIKKSGSRSSTQVSSGNSLPTFRDNLSVPYSRVKNLKMGPVGCPETSVRNYHYSLHNNRRALRGRSLKSRRAEVVRPLKKLSTFYRTTIYINVKNPPTGP